MQKKCMKMKMLKLVLNILRLDFSHLKLVFIF